MIEHVKEMREQIDRVVPLVREHLTKAQHAQQQCHNQAAQPREFQPGDWVMVLSPNSAYKFLASLQGPYTIMEKISPVTNRVCRPHAPGGRGRQPPAVDGSEGRACSTWSVSSLMCFSPTPGAIRNHRKAAAISSPRGSSVGYWGRNPTNAEVRGWLNYLTQPVVQPYRHGTKTRWHPPLLQRLPPPQWSLRVRRLPNASGGWAPGSPR